MYYRTKGKITNQYDGLMIGNGSLGALIYGDKNLLISFDKIDLWDNRLPSEYSDPNFRYSYILENIKKNNKDEIDRLFDKCYSHGFPTKLNGCKIQLNEKITNSSNFSLNTRNGSIFYKKNKLKLKCYIDAYEDVLILESNKELFFKISFPEYFYKTIENDGLGYKKSKRIIDNNFLIYEQRMYEDKKYSIISLKIKKSNKYFVLCTITNGSIEESKNLLKRYGKSIKEKKIESNSYWEKYFDTCDINTPDKRVNQLFEFGRYFFACNSRKKYPVTLQGIWTRNDDTLPPWKNDLHNDINLQMSYESYLKLGNIEEGKVLINYLLNHEKEFEEFAKTFMQSKGLLIPSIMSLYGAPLGGWPQYALYPACSIWIIKIFDDYFKYTQDIILLKNKIYPFLTKLEQCISTLLVRNDDGKYEFNIFHSSPEYFDNDKESYFNDQTNFELTTLRYLYSLLIKYSKLLNLEYQKYEIVFNDLAQDYRDENNIMKVSKIISYNVSHRHFSQILGYKNLEMYNPYNDYQLIKNDIDHVAKIGHEKWVGFSCVEMSGLYSYIRDGENAYKFLKDYECFTHRNGFFMNSDYNHTGYNEFGPYVMTLESSFGYLTSLSDMMVSTFENIICVFPAIPTSFKNSKVSFKNLRVHNGHKVSGEYNHKKLNFEIILNKEDDLLLYNNFENKPTLIVDGIKQKFDCALDTFINIKCKHSIIYKNK